MDSNPFELTAPLSNGTPLIEIGFAVGTTKQAALKAVGRRVPDDFKVFGFIDTGCSRTVIDTSIVQRLELKSTGSTTFRTARGLQLGETCSLNLRVNSFWEFKDLECAYFSNLMTDQYAVLLGLDILKEFILEVDGPGGVVKLRKRGIPRQQTDEPAYFDDAGNKFVRFDGNGKKLHYLDCGECSLPKGFKRRKQAKVLQRTK